MSGLNRVVLLALGLLFTACGLLAIAIATGMLGSALRRLGTDRVQPVATDPMLPLDTAASITTSAVTGLLVGGALLAGLSVCWLSAQRPRRSRTADFRLQRAEEGGTTELAPAVLADAVRHQVRQQPGIIAATVSIGGAVQAPQLRVHVKVDERADVGAVIGRVIQEVGGGVAMAFDATVEEFGVLVDVGQLDRTDEAAIL